MEPARIDWKRLEWHFEEDKNYENINAPKWVDFLSPDKSIDDEAWFCRPDCKHPKTVDDFLRSTPTKILSSGDSPGIIPLGDQNRRDHKLKRRVPTLISFASPDGKLKFKHDSENQNPNMVTPPPSNNPFKSMKASIKSSEEKAKLIDDDTSSMQNKVPSLRSTLSAKNLFAGRPIFSQISEFCNELKKLATRVKERENEENKCEVKSEVSVENQKEKAVLSPVVQTLEQPERKPFLEVTRKIQESNNKPKLLKKKRAGENENTPILLDLDNVRRKKDENLLQIRTNPPSPQCFSDIRNPSKTNPSKASKSRLMDRGVLQEVGQKKEEELAENSSQDVSIVDEKEARALDVFWFLKPCTLAS